jgi:hypothetical protein
MISLVIQNQPHRTFAHLKGKLVRRFARHGSILFWKLEPPANPGPFSVANRLIVLHADYLNLKHRLRAKMTDHHFE